MNIEILLAENIERDTEKDAIWRLLCESDREFFPPLSCRASTTQSEFKSEIAPDTPRAYFNKMIKQTFLLAYQEELLVGFLSFIHNYANKNILFHQQVVQSKQNNYITTICVDCESRNHGIAQKLYNAIEACLPIWLQTHFVSTRTWSANIPQINLLTKRGYALCKRITNNRKYCDMIQDTLYFIKEV